jgi:hypothetical protein
VDEHIIEGLPGFLNEVNELSIVGVLGLVVIWLIVREIMRSRYQKRARSMIEKVINGDGSPDDSMTGKPPTNPHHDPAVLFTWLVEEFRAHRKESNKRLSHIEGDLGELRGRLDALKQDGG